jgi:hypothetical protein
VFVSFVLPLLAFFLEELLVNVKITILDVVPLLGVQLT